MIKRDLEDSSFWLTVPEGESRMVGEAQGRVAGQRWTGAGARYPSGGRC